jgi:hypothetical protein
MPFEACPQPPRAELLLVWVEEGLAMATVVDESGTPSSPVTTAAVEEERTVAETAAPQAKTEPPAGADPGGADVVMVLTDDDSAPPPSAGDRDVVTSMVPEPSPAAGTVSSEDVMDLAACQYVDFPGIGTIDLDAPELPINDWEMLEVATERMFTELSILDTIASVASALRQYEGAAARHPPLRRRWQWGLLRSLRPARSQPWSRPHHRQRERTRVHPCPNSQKQSHPHLLLWWAMWRRVLSEMRGLCRPVWSPPPWRRFSCRASPPRPLKSTLPPRA